MRLTLPPRAAVLAGCGALLIGLCTTANAQPPRRDGDAPRSDAPRARDGDRDGPRRDAPPRGDRPGPPRGGIGDGRPGVFGIASG